MEKMPLSIDELVLHLTPIFSDLRKMDGTRYKGNIVKAINGALSSTGIFQRLEVRFAAESEVEREVGAERGRVRPVRAAHTEEDRVTSQTQAKYRRVCFDMQTRTRTQTTRNRSESTRSDAIGSRRSFPFWTPSATISGGPTRSETPSTSRIRSLCG